MSDRDAISYSLAVERQTTGIPLDLKKAVVTRYGLFCVERLTTRRGHSRPIPTKMLGIALD
jgi:hypothetical protein